MFSFETLQRPCVTAKVASPFPKHLHFFFEVYGVHVSPKKLLVHSLKNIYLYSRLYSDVNGCMFIAKSIQQSRKVIRRHLLYIASQSPQGREIHTIGRWEVTPPFEDLLEQEAPP